MATDKRGTPRRSQSALSCRSGTRTRRDPTTELAQFDVETHSAWCGDSWDHAWHTSLHVRFTTVLTHVQRTAASCVIHSRPRRPRRRLRPTGGAPPCCQATFCPSPAVASATVAGGRAGFFGLCLTSLARRVSCLAASGVGPPGVTLCVGVAATTNVAANRLHSIVMRCLPTVATAAGSTGSGDQRRDCRLAKPCKCRCPKSWHRPRGAFQWAIRTHGGTKVRLGSMTPLLRCRLDRKLTGLSGVLFRTAAATPRRRQGRASALWVRCACVTPSMQTRLSQWLR